MKTREYEIEVVTTKLVKVILPETYDTEEMINDWENGLWSIPDGIDDIAKYAADVSVNYSGYNHDGVGRMIENHWDKPNYEKDKFQVVAYELDDDVEVTIIKKGEFIEAV